MWSLTSPSVGEMRTAVGEVEEVVRLESVEAPATLDHTPAVPAEHEVPDRRWDVAGPAGGDHRVATAVEGHQTDPSAAEDPLQRVGADARSGGDLAAELAGAVTTEGAVEEHGHRGSATDPRGGLAPGFVVIAHRFVVDAVEGVLRERGERIEHPLGATRSLVAGPMARELVGPLFQGLGDEVTFVAGGDPADLPGGVPQRGGDRQVALPHQLALVGPGHPPQM
jgi:hypothetical protein